MKTENNYAYIDSQNLNLGVQSLGWKLDYKKFRVYLKEKYGVATAYLFIGFIPHFQNLYASLQKDGYILKFKPVLPSKDGSHKGNVDADMVLQIAVDFYERGKLEKVISPYFKTCSTLLKSTAKEKLVFIDNLRRKLEYQKKNTA